MAIALQKGKFTEKQIALADPIIQKIAKIERKKEDELNCIPDSFERQKLQRDRISGFNDEIDSLQKDLTVILEARKRFDEKMAKAKELVSELEYEERLYGFNE